MNLNYKLAICQEFSNTLVILFASFYYENDAGDILWPLDFG